MNDTFAAALNGTSIVAALTFLISIFPTLSVGGLVLRKNSKSLNRRIWLNVVLIGILTLLTIVRLIFLVQMGGNDLQLIGPNFLVATFLVVLPLAATLALTAPLLWKLRQAKQSSAPTPLTDQIRVEAASPILVVPPQSLFVGTLFSMMITVGAFSLVFSGIAVAAWLAFTGWKFFQHNRLQQKIKQNGGAAIPRFIVRAGWQSVTIVVFVMGFLGVFLYGTATTMLPLRYNMTMDPNHAANMTMAPGQKMISVADLTGQMDGTPDKTFTLTAQKAQLKLDSGQMVDAWTFNGQLPGPELRVNQGDLVQVTLLNKDVTEGVTLHWHGVDVPNAEDGVAGLTQDAVMPGQTFVYRFRADDAGTYWYHSHQFSNEQLRMGLFGAFIVDPKTPLPANTTDMTVLAHTWQTNAGSKFGFGLSTETERKAIAPGSEVRLRLVNANNGLLSFTLTGTPFQVTAIDGMDLNKPGDLSNVKLPLAAGGRYDLHFVMPDHPVLLNSSSANLLLSPDGKGDMTPGNTKDVFNPATYGQATNERITLQSHFNAEYTFDLEAGAGFYNGSFGYLYLINGQVFPNTPSISVNEGDLIKITFVNRSSQDHPMHPHGHKMLVLSRNGQAVKGSPWWTDTLNVGPGEVMTVALKADNPGLWMDHCHNLDHAANGMVMHLMYNNVMTPYEVGPDSGNDPE